MDTKHVIFETSSVIISVLNVIPVQSYFFANHYLKLSPHTYTYSETIYFLFDQICARFKFAVSYQYLYTNWCDFIRVRIYHMMKKIERYMTFHYCYQNSLGQNSKSSSKFSYWVPFTWRLIHTIHSACKNMSIRNETSGHLMAGLSTAIYQKQNFC